MIRVYLLVVIIAVFFWLKTFLQKASPEERQPYIKKSILVGLVLCFLLLAATGRLSWIIAAFSVMIAFVLRFVPLLLRYAPQVQRLWRLMRERGYFAQDKATNVRHTGVMTVDEAYKVLGLTASATAKDIIDAHRKLIAKNHPDRGGSSYLAAQINQAKNLLLKVK